MRQGALPSPARGRRSTNRLGLGNLTVQRGGGGGADVGGTRATGSGSCLNLYPEARTDGDLCAPLTFLSILPSS